MNRRIRDAKKTSREQKAPQNLSLPAAEMWNEDTTIRDQCKAANVPFFFKQWGGVRKKKTGRLLQGRTYDEMPQVQTGQMPLPDERKSIVKEIESMAQNYKVRKVTS